MASCIFCKIIKGIMPPNPEAMRPCFAFCERARAETSFLGDIPCFKLFESDKTLAFIDINPLSRGHALVIPKFHGEKLHDIPDEHLTELLNNGAIAHQEVGHVHFHMIPKPNQTEGLGIGWPQQKTDMDKLKALFEEVKGKM
ncbi:uncharacterized protein E0L32_002636 [Thyridium curvatum]|uniref:HIT domain-containing protein n=1 Tax=Thyridium curvatum TaxID=1093900 RepID=A0A507BDV3_9PEZI|nr:uncharacterized protein E0L32_002636 [Thyridium curvatum]TPX18127.1 hypothetical protein E0L32_002636 [Thyridium curvatum]